MRLRGASLINANVSIMANPRVFEDERWPEELRKEAATISSRILEPGHCLPSAETLGDDNANEPVNLLAQGYQRAISMLKPVPYPQDGEELLKLNANRKSAQYLGERFCRTAINVTFEEFENGVNHVGVEQSACSLCGDCISGCNYGAKNTTLMNYLPDAYNHGAEIYTEMSVKRVAKAGNRWRVYFQPVSLGRDKFDAPEMFVFADMVVLAAGTLGSTEILLGSKQNGLEVSDQLGKGFTGNGDVLAFGYNTDDAINGVGWGDKKAGEVAPVGPCITSVIDARGKEDLEQDMVIEEGSLPGALAYALPGLLGIAGAALGQDTDTGIIDNLQERARVADSLIRGPYHGAMQNTQTYLVMAHDGSDGEMVLEDDRLRVNWEGVGSRPVFKDIEDKLIKCVESLGGAYIPNSTWNEALGNRLVTVHPLGVAIWVKMPG